MKSIKFIPSVLLLFFGVYIIVSCTKISTDKIEQQANEAAIETKDASSSICCQINCAHGSCNAYGNPCDCHCTLFGYAKCKSNKLEVAAMSNSLFDGRTHMALSQDIVTHTTALRNALLTLGSTHARTLANKLAGISTLVSNYGYNLTTKQALLNYYDIVDAIDDAESSFTIAEINQLSAFL